MQQGAMPARDPEAVRKALQEVLDQRQFSHLNPKDGSSDFIERLFSYIQGILDAPWIKKILSLIERLTAPLLGIIKKCMGQVFSSDAIWYVLIGFCALTMIGMVIIILKTLKRNIAYSAERNKGEEAVDPGEDTETSEEKAAINEKNGDFPGALKNLYHALLMLLSEKKMAHFSDSSTNGEIEIELRRKCSDKAMEFFTQCTWQFERIFYAEAPVSEAELKQFKESYYSFKRMVL